MTMRCVIILVVLVCPVLATAQEKYIYLNLDVLKPTSNTAWIEDVTMAAGKIGYRGFIRPNFSAGLDLGWANYDQYKPPFTKKTVNNCWLTVRPHFNAKGLKRIFKIYAAKAAASYEMTESANNVARAKQHYK